MRILTKSFVMCVILCLSATFSGADDASFAIVIHGGAGGNPAAWSDDYKQKRKAGLERALDKGVALLKAGGKAIDVVEQVVRSLEDDENFNAARGCVLNEQGEHELDASIMDGQSMECGAVAGVTTPKNPITLARAVMEHTNHVLLAGKGAERFGETQGIEVAEPGYFRTEARIKAWQRWREADSRQSRYGAQNTATYFGTVGCVVVDQQGNLAAATSTGGMNGKKWGRVGDSPIIGAGTYASNASCAISGTGVGEEFIRWNIAADVSARMRYAKASLQDAASAAIGQLPENCGGIIGVDRDGNIVMEFNTQGMSRAFANSNGDRGILLGQNE